MSRWKELLQLEDWWAVWIGFFLLILVFAGLVTAVPGIAKWSSPPEGFPRELWLALLLLMVGLGGVSGLAIRGMRKPAARFLLAFPAVFVLTLLSFFVAANRTLAAFGLGYALWALLMGLIISNFFRVPAWLKPAVQTELFIKTGLVILGAEIVFGKILALGQYGIIVAWAVTPIVLISMFWFGYRLLRLPPAFAVTISAATSVCGVSAAIAAAGASKAKKEQLTLAVGMTLIFTVVMMVSMPLFCRWLGMDPLLAGAWMGGTIDSTGAVVAAGEMLGDEALQTAAVVKMIQNVLIGIIAFFIALYWVTRVEPTTGERPGLVEIWNRFPKFVLGFIVASIMVSLILVPMLGSEEVDELLGVSKNFRAWFFGLAFLCIGLESNFRELGQQMAGGRPLLLYGVGQSLNLVLTLLVAWLVFSSGILFPPLNI